MIINNPGGNNRYEIYTLQTDTEILSGIGRSVDTADVLIYTDDGMGF